LEGKNTGGSKTGTRTRGEFTTKFVVLSREKDKKGGRQQIREDKKTMERIKSVLEKAKEA